MGKLILIEGIDRTGKDSLVTFLSQYFFKHRQENECHVHLEHWGFPVGDTYAEKIKYQKKDFKQKAKSAKAFFKDHPNGILIWNRSHIGEHVYGPLYRNENTKWVKEFEINLIKNLEGLADIYLFLLDGNIIFLLSQDDGDSFTTDTNIKKEEQIKFKWAFVESQIPNKLYVSVADFNGYIELSKVQALVIEKLETNR